MKKRLLAKKSKQQNERTPTHALDKRCGACFDADAAARGEKIYPGQ